MPHPLTKEESHCDYMMISAYQDQLNAEYSKVCEMFKVYGNL